MLRVAAISLITASVLFAVFFAGNAVLERRRAQVTVAHLEPRQLVETYYLALGRRDAQTALACLTPDLGRRFASTPDSDLGSLRTLAGLKVRELSSPSSSRPGAGVAGHETLMADYSATYRGDPFKTVRRNDIVTVVKGSAVSAWKITAISKNR